MDFNHLGHPEPVYSSVAPTGIEPVFSPWKGNVLTIRRWGQIVVFVSLEDGTITNAIIYYFTKKSSFIAKY